MVLLRILVLTLAIAGCSTLKDVRESGQTASATVNAPPATAFQQLTRASRDCFSGNLRVDADYFPASQSGTVTATTGDGLATILTADLMPAATPQQTAMQVHYVRGLTRDTWRATADSMIAWANGKPAPCHYARP